MVDFARLTLAADSSGMRSAVTDIDAVGVAAGIAEGKVTQSTAAMSRAMNSVGAASGGAESEVAQSTEAIASSIDEVAAAAKKAEKQVVQSADAMSSAMKTLASAAAIAAALAAAAAYTHYADAWSDMQSTIGSAVKDMEAAPELMLRMVDISNASYSSIQQTSQAYSRNVGVLRELGLGANATADYTESLNHMLVITATKGERAASVQQVLSRAMAVGKLSGEGLETVLHSGGRVAEALAEKLGVAVSKLRSMASEGRITSSVLAGAMLDSLSRVRKEAALMPATVTDGFQRIQTGIQAIIGVFDQATGISGTFALVLVSTGDALAAVARIIFDNSYLVKVMALSLGALATGMAVSTVAAYIYARSLTAVAFASRAVTLFGGPLSLAIGVLSGLAALIMVTKKEAQSFDGAMQSLGSTIKGLETVNSRLLDDYSSLKTAQETLATATTAGGKAAIDAAIVDVAATQDRINASAELRKEKAIMAKVELAAAEAAFAAQEKENQIFAAKALINDPNTNKAMIPFVRGNPEMAAQRIPYEDVQKYVEAQKELGLQLVENGGTMNDTQRAFYDQSIASGNARIALYEQSQAIDLLTQDAKNLTIPVNGATTSIREMGGAAYATIPEFAALREEYGSMAGQIEQLLIAQNALAVSDFQARLPALTTQVSALAEGLKITKDAAAGYTKALEAATASGDLTGQAQAALDVAQAMAEAAGGAQNLTGESRASYDTFVALGTEAARLAQQVAIAGGQAQGLANEISRMGAAFGPAISAARQLAGIMSGVLGQLSRIGLRITNLIPGASQLMSALGANKPLVTRWIDTASSALGGLWNNMLRVAKEGKTVTAAIDGTGTGAGSGGGASSVAEALEEATTFAQGFSESLTQGTKSAVEMGKELGGALLGGIGSVSDAFANFIVQGFKDFKGFVNSILDSFKSMLAQMISMAIKNRIMIGLGFSGGGVGQAAAGAAGAAAGGAGAAGGGLLGGVIGSVFSGASGLVTSLFGAGGGIGAAGTYLSSVLGTATTSIGAFGAAAGAIALPLLAAVAVFSFFKKKTTELDSGIKATVTGLSTLVQAFRVVNTKQFWGLSSKTSTYIDAASQETTDAITGVVDTVQGGVLASADALGIAASTFSDFAHTMNISTKNLSEADAARAVEEALMGLADAMAGMIGGLSAFARDGEGAATTLSRLAQSLVTVNGWMGNFRMNLYDASLAGGSAAEAFAGLFGSLENFNAVASSYYDNFFTDSEQIARATELLSIQMMALGIDALPSTRAAFRALVEEADALGDTELVAALMKLAPAFAEISAGADALGESLRALVNEDLFATGQDYVRALSRSANNQEFTPRPSDAELRADMRALNVSMERMVSAAEITAGNTGRGADAADDHLAFTMEQTL